MSYDLWVTLTRGDRHHATRGTAGACLLAEALGREYGGEWSVTGTAISQAVGDQTTWEGHTTLVGKNIITRYDMTGTAKVSRRVRVARSRKNHAPRRAGQHPDGRARTSMWQPSDKILGRLGFTAAVTTSAALVAMDLTWVVFSVIGVAAGGLGMLIVRKHKAGKRHLEQAAEPPGTQKYVHVQRPAQQPAQAVAVEEPDDGMPAPAPAWREPETIYSSGPPAEIAADPDVTQPAPAEPAPISTGGEAA